MPKWVCNQTFAILRGSPKFLADKFKIATNTLLRLPCSPFVLNLKHFLREQVDSFTNHVVTKPHTYFPMLYQIYKQHYEKYYTGSPKSGKDYRLFVEKLEILRRK